MKLLFLDTETSGIDCNKDQIIEIGAVIFELQDYELKLLDYFQTTIALRKILDERITRITGITEGELVTAPSLVKAQNMYNNWIEKYENSIAGIVGHSIDFDIGFLKKEDWFLPTNSYYDTLNLAKIMLPNMQAVNLEFLSKKLEFGEILKGIPNEGLSYHRALYDSVMSANLFEYILKQVNSLECSQNFVDQLCSLFLPSGINFYKSQKTPLTPNSNNLLSLTTGIKTPNLQSITSSLDSGKLSNILELTGQPKTIGINDKIKKLTYSNALEVALNWTLPSNYKMVILQLYVISIENSNPNLHFYPKLHSLGLGFWIANFALDLFLPKISHQSFTLLNPENLIDQINRIADESINFETIATYLEILDKILVRNNVADQNIVDWLSQYEFFLVTLQPLMSNYDIKIDFINPLPDQKNIVTKFTRLLQNLRDLQLPNLKNLDSYNLIKIIENKIINFINQVKFDPSQNCNFKMTGNKHLFISYFKSNFDLNSHFITLQCSAEQIQTNLSKGGFDNLLRLAKLGCFQGKTNYSKDYNYIISDNISRLDFLTTHIDFAKKQNIPVFIVCGQNSSLKNLTKTASDFDLMNNTLVIGESGGITKIASKVDQGFVGVVIFKFSNLDYFLHLRQAPNLGKIVLYDRPYFFIHEYWYKQSKTNRELAPETFLKTLKDIYLQGKINQIHNYFGCNIELFYNLF